MWPQQNTDRWSDEMIVQAGFFSIEGPFSIERLNIEGENPHDALGRSVLQEKPVQRSALSATALTCTAAGAHEMFRRRRQQMLWPQPRAARL